MGNLGLCFIKDKIFFLVLTESSMRGGGQSDEDCFAKFEQFIAPWAEGF